MQDSQSTPEFVPSGPARPRILVIDDDTELRELLVRVLESAGYETSQATNGVEGVRAVESEPPDLVLTDIVMPEQEGIETILQLRASHADLPVIAMSGGTRFGSGDYLKIAERLGASVTLAKPFAPADLMAAVSRLLPMPSSV